MSVGILCLWIVAVIVAYSAIFAAGWCYPFRTEARSNFEVVHIVSE